MARKGNLDTSIYIDKFKGINNLSDDKDLINDELSDALNIDITRTGGIKSREGWNVKIPLSNGHSLYSDSKNMFFVDEDNLYKTDQNYNKEIIDIGYSNLKTSFLSYNNSVYISNKNFIKRYKGNKIYDISPPRFINQFNTTFYNDGGFPKGNYLIAITYVFSDGIEGGTSSPIRVSVEENQGIILNNLPLNTDINISSFRVYISPINAESLKFYGDFNVNDTQIQLRYTHNLGKDLTTFNLKPLESGDFIEQYKGVIFTAKNNIIYMSEPLSNLTEGKYYEFDGEINLLCAVKNGLYISDEYNCYFLSGNDPHNLDRDIIYNEPAIKGSHSKNISTREIFFFTKIGQIVGDDNGGIKNITEQMFLPKRELLEGASIIKMRDGLKQIINSFRAGEENKMGVSDKVEVTIERAKN